MGLLLAGGRKAEPPGPTPKSAGRRDPPGTPHRPTGADRGRRGGWAALHTPCGDVRHARPGPAGRRRVGTPNGLSHLSYFPVCPSSEHTCVQVCTCVCECECVCTRACAAPDPVAWALEPRVFGATDRTPSALWPGLQERGAPPKAWLPRIPAQWPRWGGDQSTSSRAGSAAATGHAGGEGWAACGSPPCFTPCVLGGDTVQGH